MILRLVGPGHVNDRSLCIVDWRLVVVEGRNVLHHVNRDGELSRGICPGKYI